VCLTRAVEGLATALRARDVSALRARGAGALRARGVSAFAVQVLVRDFVFDAPPHVSRAEPLHVRHWSWRQVLVSFDAPPARCLVAASLLRQREPRGQFRRRTRSPAAPFVASITSPPILRHMPAKKRPTAKDAATPATASPTTPGDTASESTTPTSRRRSSAASAAAADETKPAAKKGATKRTADAAKVTKVGAKTPATAKSAPAKSKRASATPDAELAAAAAPAVTTNVATAARPTPAVATDKAVPRLVVTEASIRQQAYFLSLRRNASGDPVADWLEAERLLRAQAD
jgi:hypothetical protein